MLQDLFKVDAHIVCAHRRKRFISHIQHAFPEIKKGRILLIGGLEQGHNLFEQESTFYYLTGFKEPGLVMMLDLNGHTTVYVPAYRHNRGAWSRVHVSDQSNPASLGVDQVKLMGQPLQSSNLTMLFGAEQVHYVLEDLKSGIEHGEAVFVVDAHGTDIYIQQQLFLYRLCQFAPELKQKLIDIAPIVAELRRTKQPEEIELICKAVELASIAQNAAADSIAIGESESIVQASLEWVITAAGGRTSFPSIVATGKNATILHYTDNNAIIQKNELVVVDIGARIEGYCSDLTRTYPASGTFNTRQRELYRIVLEVQKHIEETAKPGFWLTNNDKPEQSLNHLAKKAFAHYGLEKFFIHNIGHFLGLDVHDVGNVALPLKEGDVITIEPGLYIPDEGIGIRIEDDYLVAGKGVVCLSDDLIKEIEDIEALMKKRGK